MKNPIQLSTFTSLLYPQNTQPKRRKSRSKLSFEKLEARNLLASVSLSAATFGDQLQFTSDAGIADSLSVESTPTGSIQFRVANGESISISNNAIGNPSIRLSTFATTNDTLTIDPAGNFGSGFGRLDVVAVDLGDLDDSLTIGLSLDEFVFSETLGLFFNSGSGDDMVDASTSTTSVRIVGGSGSDRIVGGSGNDTILGDQTDRDAGHDVLFGGPGNDYVSGSSGADVINGGAGNDTLVGGEGLDTIDGGEGIDTNSFLGVSNSVTATATANGSGTAEHGVVEETFVNIEGLAASANGDVLTLDSDTGGTLTGGAGDDTLTGGSGNDRLIGGDGDDILRGGPGNDALFGGLGNDSLNGGDNNDELYGGAGDDFFVGIGGTDAIFGGAGEDTNSFQGVGSAVTAVIRDDGSGTASYGTVDETFSDIESLVGSEFDDILTVEGSRPTTLLGLEGNDTLSGGAGADTLVGAEGNDVLRGGAGNDTIMGNDGDDILNGNDGDDTLFGDAGDDFFVGIGGIDTIHGGAGIDTNSFQGVDSGVTATVNFDNSGTASYGLVQETFTGIENLTGSDHDDVLSVYTERDTVLRGRGGSDILTSSTGNDRLIGGAGDDILRSGRGNDTSYGGDGNDRLNGGDGDDMLFGAEGDDFFVGIGGTDLISGGNGFDLNSFEGIDLEVNVVRTPDGSGTARYGTVVESFTGIDAFFNAIVVEVPFATIS